jgi:hypothetical protein
MTLMILKGISRRAMLVCALLLPLLAAAQAVKPLLPRGRPYEVAGAERLVPVPSEIGRAHV